MLQPVNAARNASRRVLRRATLRPIIVLVIGSDPDAAGLVAELRPVLQRAFEAGRETETHCLTIDVARQKVVAGDRTLALTPTEFALLAALARRPGIVLPPAALSAAMNDGQKPLTLAMLYTTVSTIRRKLQDAGLPFAIRTVRRRGYALSDDTAAQLWQ